MSTYTVNGLNQVTGSPAGPHGYDLNGNMTSAGLRTWYGYDDENQLTTASFMASDWSTGWRTEFMYDGKMRLRKQTDYWWNSSGGTNGTWSAGAERRFIYDGMLVAQERNGSNLPLTSYTRGPDLSGTLEGAGGIGGLLGRSQSFIASTGVWAIHHHYHADGNGNITYLVTASQGLAALYKYDPYGNLITSGGAFAGYNLYRFSSKMYVNSPGLYYYGYRFYNPSLQRWPNRDPLGEPGFEMLRGGQADPLGDGPNLYAFVHNDPIDQTDPLGLYGSSIENAVRTCMAMPTPALRAKCMKDLIDTLGGGQSSKCCVLAAAVQVAKKGAQALGKWKSSDSCAVLRVKSVAWLALAAARNRLHKQCFGGGNAGHQKQVAQIYETVAKCTKYQVNNGCTGPL